MKFYDPFSKLEITACKEYLENDGFKVIVNSPVIIQLSRENNSYKKALKWHITGTQDNATLFSQWFASKKMAIEHITQTRPAFKVGESFSVTPYTWAE